MLSLAGILAYIAFRFQFSFAVGAVVATLHDLLVTLAFLAFFRYDMTLNVIAGAPDDHRLLDQRHDRHLRPRAREPARHAPRLAGARSSTSRSTRRSAGRSSPPGTALLSALALYLFGGEVLRGLRVHDGRRHHHRHLLDRLHRRGDRHHAGRGAKPLKRPASPAAGRARRSSRRASRSRSGRPARRRPLRVTAVSAAALLGIVQGLTEFLPVSSSAHLILGARFFGWDVPPSSAWRSTSRCQIGTLAAIVAFFRARSLVDGRARCRRLLVAGAPIALGAARAADRRRHAAGRRRRRCCFGDFVESVLTNAGAWRPCAFVVGGVVMLLVERLRPPPTAHERVADAGCEALLIGVRAGAGARPGRLAFRRDDHRRHVHRAAARRGGASSRSFWRCRRCSAAVAHESAGGRGTCARRQRGARDRHRHLVIGVRRLRWRSSPFLRFVAAHSASTSFAVVPASCSALALARGDGGWLAVRCMQWLRRSFIAGFFVTVPLVHQRRRARLDLPASSTA